MSKPLIIKPADPDAGCDVHDWPTKGLPFRLARAVARPEGLNVCRECVDRAKAEADSERLAKCILCQRGVHRSPRGSHGYRGPLGMYDVACPITEASLEKLHAQIEDAVGDMFPEKEESD